VSIKEITITILIDAYKIEIQESSFIPLPSRLFSKNYPW
jgi:hypothetical protein